MPERHVGQTGVVTIMDLQS
ncbi:hypothetical protein [Mesorhizobium sangaii]